MPKKRHRGDEQKEELRNLILQAASEMFIEFGYDNFSMRKLAQRIGYSAATLYLYFRDKDDLLFTVVDEAFTGFERKLEESAKSSGDPWEKLGRLGEAYVLFGLNNPVHYQLMFMRRIDYLTESRREGEGPRVKAFEILSEAVRDAIDQEVMQPGDPEIYSDFLWATMHGIISLSIQMPMFDKERTRKLTEHSKNMIFRALHK